MADSFAAQQAARLSAQELHELTKELFNWSKDAKQKAGRKGLAAEAAPAKTSAAAAGQSAGITKQPEQQATASATRHPAAHTYDNYRAKWDKFDVDAALAEDDDGSAAQRPGSGNGVSRASTSQPLAIPKARVTVPVGPSPPAAPASSGSTAAGPAPTTADGWKDAGNEHFKHGRYRQAIECYSASLAIEPTCLAAANRAMARLKLGQHEAAEADCSEALRLDPLYVKAYQRRATARRQLGNLAGAIDDCEWVLRLEPNNKQAAADRAAYIQKLLKEEGLQPPSRSEQLEVRVAQAQPAAAAAAGGGAARSPGAGPPLAAADDGAEELLKVSSVRRHSTAPEAERPGPSLQAQEQAEVRGAGTPKQVAAVAPTAAIQVLDTDSVEAVPDLMEPATQQEQQKQEQRHEIAVQAAAGQASSLQEQQQPTSVSSAAPEAKEQQLAVDAVAASVVGSQAAVRAPSAPTSPLLTAGLAAACQRLRPPRTGLEFEKAWKGLKGDPKQQADYLLALEPNQLPTLLKQALTPALLAAATTALLCPALQQQPAPAVALLESLAQVQRFDINMLSVPPRQKAELRMVWDVAASKLGVEDNQLAARLAEVRQKYKL